MFFVLDENKNLIEGYDKEGVLALLEQAIEDGDLSGIEADSAFVSKLKSLVNGTTHHIEFVTQAQYNAMEQAGTLVPNTYYFITDDDTAEDLENAVNRILDGTTAVPNAEEALNAGAVNNLAIMRDANGVLKIGNTIIPQKILIAENVGSYTSSSGDASLTIKIYFDSVDYEMDYAKYLVEGTIHTNSDDKFQVIVVSTERAVGSLIHLGIGGTFSAVAGVIGSDTYKTVPIELNIEVWSMEARPYVQFRFTSGNDMSYTRFDSGNTITIDKVYKIIE